MEYSLREDFCDFHLIRWGQKGAWLGGGLVQNTYELLNLLETLKISMQY